MQRPQIDEIGCKCGHKTSHNLPITLRSAPKEIEVIISQVLLVDAVIHFPSLENFACSIKHKTVKHGSIIISTCKFGMLPEFITHSISQDNLWKFVHDFRGRSIHQF